MNSLIIADMHNVYFNEFTENFFDSGNMQYSIKRELYEYNYNANKYPMSFSLKASVYQKNR